MSNYKFVPIDVRAHGKIMLAGEWAVLELGAPCLVLALDKGISVHIEPSDAMRLVARDVGIESDFSLHESGSVLFKDLDEAGDENAVYVVQALRFVFAYLKELGHDIVPCKILIESEFSGKAGLGSSAAVVAGVVKGLCAFYGLDVSSRNTLHEVFKLSLLSHYIAQGYKGSGFDVAAALFGGALLYVAFDGRWLKKKLSQYGRKIISLKTLLNDTWPHCSVFPVSLPADMRVSVGFTGRVASTEKMIEKMEKFKQKNKKIHKAICTNISDTVRSLTKLFHLYPREKKFCTEAILYMLELHRNELLMLGRASGMQLETPELERLCDVATECGAVGKLSGSGGGDCGIAVCFDPEVEMKVLRRWAEDGIEFVYQRPITDVPSDVAQVANP